MLIDEVLTLVMKPLCVGYSYWLLKLVNSWRFGQTYMVEAFQPSALKSGRVGRHQNRKPQSVLIPSAKHKTFKTWHSTEFGFDPIYPFNLGVIIESKISIG